MLYAVEEEEQKLSYDEQIKELKALLDVIENMGKEIIEIKKEIEESKQEKATKVNEGTLEGKIVIFCSFYQALVGHPPPLNFLVDCTKAKEYEVRRAIENLEKEGVLLPLKLPASKIGLKLAKTPGTEKTILVSSKELKKNEYERVAGRPPELIAVVFKNLYVLYNAFERALNAFDEEYLLSSPFVDATRKFLYSCMELLLIIVKHFHEQSVELFFSLMNDFSETLKKYNPELTKPVEDLETKFKEGVRAVKKEDMEKAFSEISKFLNNDDEMRKFILFMKERVKKQKYISIESDEERNLSFLCNRCFTRIRVPEGISKVSCKVCGTKYKIIQIQCY